MTDLVVAINERIWSIYFIILALGTGLYLTIRMKAGQFRLLRLMGKFTFEKRKDDTGRTPFQAFALALGGRVGTGNVAGVATAIAVGGPGAVFWMWMSCLLGAGTSIAENTLSQVYKTKEGNEYRGGPSYFIHKGLGMKWFAMLFAVVSVLAIGFCTAGLQANTISDAMNTAFGVKREIMGVIVAIVTGLTIMGGVKRITKVAEILVPLMATFYVIIGLILIALNFSKVPGVFSLIFSSAFGQNAVFGGLAGSAVNMGVKRGIFSNEAGMGTAAQAAATASVSHPVKQGLVQALSVYIDTIIVCTITAVMVLVTGMYNIEGVVENLPGVEAGPAFVQNAANTLMTGFGPAFVACSLFFFAFTTILSNYYAAETGVAYICGEVKKIREKHLMLGLRLATLVVIILCSARSSSLVWEISDMGLGLMSWLNFISIVLLSNVAIKVFKDFEKQYKETGDAVFDPKKLGIKNADYWEEKINAQEKQTATF